MLPACECFGLGALKGLVFLSSKGGAVFVVSKVQPVEQISAHVFNMHNSDQQKLPKCGRWRHAFEPFGDHRKHSCGEKQAGVRTC